MYMGYGYLLMRVVVGLLALFAYNSDGWPFGGYVEPRRLHWSEKSTPRKAFEIALIVLALGFLVVAAVWLLKA